MTKRREFTPKTKLAAFEQSGGRCENCGVKIRPGNGPEYDHINPDYFDGDNDLNNCQVLCRNCHKGKTSKIDIPNISKSRRMRKNAAGIKKRTNWPGGKNSPWKHKVNGEWVRR